MLIGRMLKGLVETMDALSLDERALLCQANARAFRHTFGTQSVADEVPVDVVQKVLGHASLATPRSMCRPRKSRCSKKSPAIMRGARNKVWQRRRLADGDTCRTLRLLKPATVTSLHPIPHGEQYLNAGFAM